LPQGRDEQNDTDCDCADAAHNNPCGHPVISSLSPVQLSCGWRRKLDGQHRTIGIRYLRGGGADGSPLVGRPCSGTRSMTRYAFTGWLYSGNQASSCYSWPNFCCRIPLLGLAVRPRACTCRIGRGCFGRATATTSKSQDAKIEEGCEQRERSGAKASSGRLSSLAASALLGGQPSLQDF
jgi:hypothetical protein